MELLGTLLVQIVAKTVFFFLRGVNNVCNAIADWIRLFGIIQKTTMFRPLVHCPEADRVGRCLLRKKKKKKKGGGVGGRRDILTCNLPIPSRVPLENSAASIPLNGAGSFTMTRTIFIMTACLCSFTT